MYTPHSCTRTCIGHYTCCVIKRRQNVGLKMWIKHYCATLRTVHTKWKWLPHAPYWTVSERLNRTVAVRHWLINHVFTWSVQSNISICTLITVNLVQANLSTSGTAPLAELAVLILSHFSGFVSQGWPGPRRGTRTRGTLYRDKVGTGGWEDEGTHANLSLIKPISDVCFFQL